MGLINVNYKGRLEKLKLKPLELRRKLYMLKLLFKCIYNSNDVPNSWKLKFQLKNTRNGIFLSEFKARALL